MPNPGKEPVANVAGIACHVCGAFAAMSWYTCTDASGESRFMCGGAKVKDRDHTRSGGSSRPKAGRRGRRAAHPTPKLGRGREACVLRRTGRGGAGGSGRSFAGGWRCTRGEPWLSHAPGRCRWVLGLPAAFSGSVAAARAQRWAALRRSCKACGAAHRQRPRQRLVRPHDASNVRWGFARVRATATRVCCVVSAVCRTYSKAVRLRRDTARMRGQDWRVCVRESDQASKLDCRPIVDRRDCRPS